VKAPKGFNLKLAHPRQGGKQTYCSFCKNRVFNPCTDPEDERPVVL
jgi:hypothetical protein